MTLMTCYSAIPRTLCRRFRHCQSCRRRKRSVELGEECGHSVRQKAQVRCNGGLHQGASIGLQ